MTAPVPAPPRPLAYTPPSARAAAAAPAGAPPRRRPGSRARGWQAAPPRYTSVEWYPWHFGKKRVLGVGIKQGDWLHVWLTPDEARSLADVLVDLAESIDADRSR